MANKKDELLEKAAEKLRQQPDSLNLLKKLKAKGMTLEDILKLMKKKEKKKEDKTDNKKIITFRSVRDKDIEKLVSGDEAKEIVNMERERDKSFFVKLCKECDEKKIYFWLRYISQQDINVFQGEILELAEWQGRSTSTEAKHQKRGLSTEIIRQILAIGANVDARNENGDTALIIAIKKRLHRKTIKFLLREGADINARDKDGNTPLMIAIKNKIDVEDLIFLIKEGANVNAKDNRGNTALSIACDMEKHDKAQMERKITEELLYYGANPLQEDNKIRDYLLQRKYIQKNYLPKHNSLKKTRLMYFLEAGVEDENKVLRLLGEIDKTDKNKKTAFMYAIDGNVGEDILKILIEIYSKIKQKNEIKKAIKYAIKTSNVHMTKCLIDECTKESLMSEVNVNTLLRYAVKYRSSLNIVKLMLDLGADVNAMDEDGISILTYAIKNKTSVEVVKKLIEKGAKINERDDLDHNIIKYAIHSEACIEIIELLIKNGAQINVSDVDGYNLLMSLMSMMRHVKDNILYIRVLDLLLDSGADVNAKDNHDISVLMYALRYNVSVEAIEKLIEKGAKINERDDRNFSAIMYAVRNGASLEILDLLVKKGVSIEEEERRGDKFLINALDEEVPEEVIKFLVENGANVNAVDDRGVSVIMHAITKTIKYNTSTEILDFLIKKGADVNAADDWGIVVIMHAINRTMQYNRSKKVVEFLIEKGADVNVVNNQGISVVMYAINKTIKYNTSLEVLDLLVEKGVSIEKEERRGVKFLINALSKSAPKEVIEFLINNGANINMVIKKENMNLLMFAIVKHLSLEVINALLDGGVDLNAKDIYGNSVLEIAMMERAPKLVIEELLKRGIETNMKNNRGYSVLESAEYYKLSQDIIKLLLEYGANPLIKSEWSIEIPPIDQIVAENKVGKNKLMYYLEAGKPFDEIKQILEKDKKKDVNYSKDKKTLFMYAIDGNVEERVLDLLIEYGEDINNLTAEGETLLTYAVKRSHEDMIGCLLRKGLDINKSDQKGDTPLLAAIKSGKVDVIRYVLESGARVGDKSIIDLAIRENIQMGIVALLNDLLKIEHRSVIKRAGEELTLESSNKKVRYSPKNILYLCKKELEDRNIDVQSIKEQLASNGLNEQNNEECILMEILKRVPDIDARNNNGSTLLMGLLKYNVYKNIVNFMLDNGAQINAVNKDGENLLMYAVNFNSSLEVVRLLIARGININSRARNGSTVLEIAKRKNADESIIEELLAYGANPFMSEATESMISEINKNKIRKSGLMYILESGRCKSERILRYIEDLKKIENKYGKTSLEMEINKVDGIGKTPIMYAIDGDVDESVLDVLIMNGANISELTSEGETILAYAVKRSKKMVELLINKNIDINKQDRNGRIALMVAIKKEVDKDLIKFLIDKGSNVNIVDNNMSTVLMYAIKYNAPIDIVKILIEKGANVNAIDNGGCTAINLAYKFKGDYNKKKQLIDMLLEYGANPLIGISKSEKLSTDIIDKCAKKNKIGKTGLMYALEAGGLGYEIKPLLGEVDKVDKSGKTVLMYAIDGKFNKEVLYLLLKNSKSARQQMQEGNELLRYAIKKATTFNLLLLINEKLNINAKDSKGYIALRTAIENKESHKLIDFLIDAGALVGDKTIIELARDNNVSEYLIRRLQDKLKLELTKEEKVCQNYDISREEAQELGILKEVKQERDWEKQRQNTQIPRIDERGFLTKE